MSAVAFLGVNKPLQLEEITRDKIQGNVGHGGKRLEKNIKVSRDAQGRVLLYQRSESVSSRINTRQMHFAPNAKIRNGVKNTLMFRRSLDLHMDII